MKCERCYFENPDDSKSCIICGQKLKIKKKTMDDVKKHVRIKVNINQNPTTTHNPIKAPIVTDIKKHNPNDYYLVEYVGPDESTTQSKVVSLNNDVKKKNKILTVLLSLIVIGAGHVYLGLIKRGLVFLAIAVITGYMVEIWPEAMILWGINCFIQVIDAYICCEKINNTN